MKPRTQPDFRTGVSRRWKPEPWFKRRCSGTNQCSEKVMKARTGGKTHIKCVPIISFHLKEHFYLLILGGKKHRFVGPLIHAFIGGFLYEP